MSALLGFVSDASHGWLVVSTSVASGYPDATEWASHFSFIGDEQVFLEEDEDAPRFLREHGLSLHGVPEIELSDEEGEALRMMERGTAEFEH